MTVGKKEFALKNYSLVEDINNKLISAVHYLKKDSKGFFKGIFGKKKNKDDIKFPDEIKGGIYNSNDVKINNEKCKHEINENANELVSLSGRWIVELEFEDKIYWKMNDMPLNNVIYLKLKILNFQIKLLK